MKTSDFYLTEEARITLEGGTIEEFVRIEDCSCPDRIEEIPGILIRGIDKKQYALYFLKDASASSGPGYPCFAGPLSAMDYISTLNERS